MATICVVDDEPGIREELKDWLADYGYGVLSPNSAAEALEQIETFQPSLVILDIIMPDIDGLEVLARLKANPKTAAIPVIMLSAKKESSTIIRAQALKAADYFMKPFEGDEVLKSIERHLY
jgi:DNA-binding response OmpR family regulator